MNRREALGFLAASASVAGMPDYLPSSPKGGMGDVGLNILTPKSYGAVGDGVALDTHAINAAIDACSAGGGGIVYLAPGRYLCGTVELKSFVTLYLEAGSVILGSKEISQYSPKAGPSQVGDASQRHLIFAQNVQDVSIVGTGKIDGQGQSFWRPSDRKPPEESNAWLYAKHRDWAPNPRVSPMIELVNCTNLHIESITITGASGWTLRPVNCSRVFIQGITLFNPAIGPNTDGIDLTGCQDVVISDCLINTGDDAICLKSENPYGPSARLAKNIAVTNCILTSSTTGFKIGTASQGGLKILPSPTQQWSTATLI